jgi:hypothetical protein
MDFVASARRRRLCPLGPLRTRAGSTARYAMQGIAEKGAGEEERRRDEGAGERAKEVAREEERRRDEGTGEEAKEVARTAGGEAAGAGVIGG